MGNAFLLEVIDGRQEMFAKAAHEVEGERVAAADPLGERLVAGPLHEDGGTARGRDLCDEADDVLSWWRRRRTSRFGADSVRVSIVKRHLQNQFLVGTLTLDKEDVGAAAAAEPTLDDEAAVEPVAGISSCRIGGGYGSRLRWKRLLLRLCKVVEKLPRIPRTIANDRRSGDAHHLLKPAACAIHRSR